MVYYFIMIYKCQRYQKIPLLLYDLKISFIPNMCDNTVLTFWQLKLNLDTIYYKISNKLLRQIKVLVTWHSYWQKILSILHHTRTLISYWHEIFFFIRDQIALLDIFSLHHNIVWWSFSIDIMFRNVLFVVDMLDYCKTIVTNKINLLIRIP